MADDFCCKIKFELETTEVPSLQKQYVQYEYHALVEWRFVFRCSVICMFPLDRSLLGHMHLHYIRLSISY
jgi:hypothetical protein